MRCVSRPRLASGSSARLPTCSKTVDRVTAPPRPNGWNASYTARATSRVSALLPSTLSQKASKPSETRHAVSTSRYRSKRTRPPESASSSVSPPIRVLPSSRKACAARGASETRPMSSAQSEVPSMRASRASTSTLAFWK